MNILGISGSPKENGFTNILLDEVLKGAQSEGATTDKILLNNLQIKPCQECGSCSEGRACAIHDGASSVYDKLKRQDAIVIASPIYFGSVSAQLKAFIDRAQHLWEKKRCSGKNEPDASKRRGVFLCLAGRNDRAYFKNAKSIIRIFFKILDTDYYDDLFFGNFDAKNGESSAKKLALKKVFNIGKRISRANYE